MPYAQINYKQQLGDSRLTIAEAGCFITADCNLLEDIGVEVNPADLDTYYKNHGLFIYDAADQAHDDIAWDTVCKFQPGLRLVDQRNDAGWPQSNFAIVKFYYKSHTGFWTTHFCKVHDWTKKQVVDSWNGSIITVGAGTYYGEPVAFGVFAYDNPAAQQAPAAQAPAGPSFEIFVNVPGYTTSNDAANHINPNGSVMSPGKYYVFNEAHGMVNITHNPGQPGEWINPSDNHLAPQPEAAPAPAPVKPANTEYTKLAQPLNLMVNKESTNWWKLDFKDYAHTEAAAVLPKGTLFRAFGKAQRTDGDRPVYYMTEEDFGQADTTGIPVNNNGINTVDLSPAPAPAPVEAAQPAIEITPAVATPAPEPTPAPVENSTPSDGTDDNHIIVKVLPGNPESWKATFKTNAAGEYIANADVKVYDVNNPASDPQQLVRGQKVVVAGDFTGPDGIRYYRTAKSVERNVWYAIPVIALSAENLAVDAATLLNPDFITESREILGKLSTKEKAIRTLASAEASSLLARFKKH